MLQAALMSLTRATPSTVADRRPRGAIHTSVTVTLPLECAATPSATSASLENLYGVEKGWLAPTPSVTAMSEPARARAAWRCAIG